MEEGNTTRPSLPWPAQAMSSGLMRELGRILQDEIEDRRAIFVHSENTLRFHHGHMWNIRRADASEDSSEFRTLQSLLPMSYEDVMCNDLGKLAEAINAQAEALAQQEAALMFEKTDEAVQATGNQVSFEETGSFAEGYLEMLRRSMFFANEEGAVTPPNIYANPETGAEIESRRDQQGPIFKLHEQEIMHEKAAEAIRRERERLARYEGFDESDDG